jgi:hypothetical protein
MKTYLAGGITGNLSPYWKSMKVYIAGNSCFVKDRKNGETINPMLAARVNLLESYFYLQDWQINLIPLFKSFMLDSGAFSFMSGLKQKLSWDDYAQQYAEFVKEHNIKLFFELDIDKIVGLREVDRLRGKIESIVGRQSIPVFHRARGKDYFLSIVKNYPYVAIGGIAIRDIVPKEYKHLIWFIDKAHEHNCKIHGLGFTKVDLLPYLQFDSVDSTAWIYGNRSGFVVFFDGKKLIRQNKGNGQRLDARKVAFHNFEQWVRFAEYMENNTKIYLAGNGGKKAILCNIYS